MPRKLQPKNPDNAVKKLLAMRGVPAAIAREAGIARQSVYEWRKVPPQWVHIVAGLIDMSPEEIRPDIFRPKKSA